MALNSAILHIIAWLLTAVLFIVFTIQNNISVDATEEILWLAISNSFAIEAYKHFQRKFLLSAWTCYSLGLLFDILEDIPGAESNILFQQDTSLKNLGFILVCIGLSRLIMDKKKSIALLESEIAQRKNLQDQLEYDATHDALTKIFNRRACFDYFKTRQQQYSYLLYFDLNDFKKANDTYGHNIGDLILKDFTAALTEIFQLENCFRVGGDEFLAFSNDNSYLHNQDEVKYNLLKKISTYNVGVSIGIVELDDTNSADTLIHRADQAMYREKFRMRELALSKVI